MSGRQWQCGECGAWVDDGWGIHQHREKLPLPTLEDIIAMRRLDELNIPADDPLNTQPMGKVSTYLRTGKEPTRDKPL